MNRVINFAAGPAAMPYQVLQEIEKDLCNYKGLGLSVMEMSHRSKMYEPILNEAKETLKELLELDDNYDVLFLQGGASHEFAMVPLNLANEGDLTYYAVTGNFANKAWEEAKKWTDARDITNSKEDKYKYIPEIDVNKIDKKARYLHITANNTIFGTMYHKVPEIPIPLVADVSSNILGKHYDYKKFTLAYAGAQKNLGPAGLTVVIIDKKYLTENHNNYVPTMLKYTTHAQNNSMYNTPPTYTIYVAGEVFKYLLENGGIPAMHEKDVRKAQKLYDYLDSSKLFKGTVAKEDRSLMNVTFVTGDEELDKKFVAGAKERGMINLKGHRIVGGCRASIYNAMPEEGVDALVAYMKEFEAAHK